MKALTYLHLPYTNVAKSPGDLITKDELYEARQTDEQIQSLVDNGAIGNDDDPLHPDHHPVGFVLKEGTVNVNVYVSDTGEGVTDA